VPRDPSLALGATKKGARGDISHPVIPRYASAEGPLACARGDKKGGSGRQRSRLGTTTGGLAQIFNTASNKPIAFIFRFVIF
jgi:hypothetical protein